MPLFETIGFDKHAVVIDIGSRYTKFGFAGEQAPRCIIPSQVKDLETGTIRSIFSFRDETDLYALLVEFVHMLYFKHVLVSPKDRRAVIIESLLCPTLFRDTLAKVLFRHFEVSSVLYAPTHLVSLCTLGVGTGLVLDIGHQEAILIPVYEGVPVLSAWQAQPLAGKAVEARLKNDLVEHYKSVENMSGDTRSSSAAIANLSDSVIEDIKVRACFVTNLERANRLAGDLKPAPDLDYRVAGSQIIKIPGKIRESSHEVFFERDNDQLSIPNMILDAIAKCSVDMRKQLAENIFLIGGMSMTPGLKYRLNEELKHLLSTPSYAEKLKIKDFKFHTSIVKENFASWLGGAIFGATDMLAVRSLTRESYLGYRGVPDWCSLVHNTKSESEQFKWTL